MSKRLQTAKLAQMYLHWFDDCADDLTELQMLENIAVQAFLAGEDAKCQQFDSNEIWLVQWGIKELRNGKTNLEDCYGWDDMEEDE